MEKIWYYYAVLNLLTFFLYLLDKRRAKKHRRRIRETTLLAFSMLGGALGAFFAMQIFRHKTEKPLFQVLVPLSLALHLIFIWFIAGGKIL